MSFEYEQRLIRMRPRGGRLFLPTLLLGLAAFLMGFGFDYLTEAWQQYLIYGCAAALALFGWLLPLLRYLSSWVEITTARTMSRSGLFGQHFEELSHAQVKRVELVGRKIYLIVDDEVELELKSVAKPKLVAAELAKLVAH